MSNKEYVPRILGSVPEASDLGRSDRRIVENVTNIDNRRDTQIISAS